MSAVAIGLNLLLAALLAAALAMGWRLNLRLKTLRESQAGFAKAVADLNAAAARAERGLADLRAAGDEAMELLSERITKGRELAAKLEGLTAAAEAAASRSPARPAAPRAGEDVLELGAADRRLGALLADAQRRRPAPEPPPRAERPLTLSRAKSFDDDLFESPGDDAELGRLRLRR